MQTFAEFIAEDESVLRRSVQNLITSRRRMHTRAADVYHDVMKAGEYDKWFDRNIVPIWKKHGRPNQGDSDWGKVEQEVIKKFL